MACEYRLHAGQQMVMALPEGAEIFCAEGSVRIRATPSVFGGGPAPGCELAAGRGWRAHERASVMVEAGSRARFEVTVPQPVPPEPAKTPAHEKSLRLWGRRLFGAA